MTSRQRMLDWLAAATIVVAFGGLFFGRLMIYPVSTAPGDFLERVAARSDAWDHGHRWMLVGMVCLVGAALALWRAMHERSPVLSGLATTLVVLGATLGVGQYALDFAMLAAAQIEPAAARAPFAAAFQENTFVQWTFYRLPDLSQAGLILFTVALWRQGTAWRLPATLVTLAALASLILPQLIAGIGVRIALGMAFVGFTTVAWKIAVTRPESIVSEVGPRA